jgi:hypothetical protein
LAKFETWFIKNVAVDQLMKAPSREFICKTKLL